MYTNQVLLLTEGDPWGEPKGGQTTFAKHLLIAFGNRLAISSHCDDSTIPVGEWIKRTYLNIPILFFNRGSLTNAKNAKPLVPARISAYLIARKFMSKIRKVEFDGVLIDSPEMLFAASPYSWKSLCYSFAGLNNPVANSRYPWARFLGNYFENYHVATLKKIRPDAMIASADIDAINEFHYRTANLLNTSKFYQFPTRVDTDLFHPILSLDARNKLNINHKTPIFVVTGRLCWIKGWDLILDAFVFIKNLYPNALLIFVGDGEDHLKITSRAQFLGLSENIMITSFVSQSDVVLYMNAADVCLIGSYREGWSLAMCEMVACGKPIVTTSVSGARDMVKDDINGFVINSREPKEFSDAMIRALDLKDASDHSLHLAERYSVKFLANELGALWAPLRF